MSGSAILRIAAINKWTEEERGIWLKVRLTYKVWMALTWFLNDAHGSYSSLKSALTERFDRPSKQNVYKTGFKSQWKKMKSWGDFVLQLVDKAFPTL